MIGYKASRGIPLEWEWRKNGYSNGWAVAHTANEDPRTLYQGDAEVEVTGRDGAEVLGVVPGGGRKQPGYGNSLRFRGGTQTPFPLSGSGVAA